MWATGLTQAAGAPSSQIEADLQAQVAALLPEELALRGKPVVGVGKEPKIYVFKFKRRKNYRRKTGHRQKYTEVRITDLKLG